MSLVEDLKKRVAARPTIEVEASEFVRDEVKGSLRVRALTVGEKSDSAEAAIQFRKGLLRDIPETHSRALLDDAEFIDDQKLVERLFRACRDANDVNKPAFPSAQYIRDTFTAAEVIRLKEWYDRAERANEGLPDTLTREHRLALVKACAAAATMEHGERILDGMPRHLVVSLFLWLCAEHEAVSGSAQVGDMAFVPDAP